jgi:hypothetical protein
VVGLAWSEGPESYAGGRVATGRGSHAGQVKGDDPDKKRYPGPPDWGLGVGLTIPLCKTWICLETSIEASEGEEGWGDHGPKTGRSAIEEEEGVTIVFRLPDCWLVVSMHPEGPATDHLTQVFLVFLCLKANAEMVPKFQVATASLSCNSPFVN